MFGSIFKIIKLFPSHSKPLAKITKNLKLKMRLLGKQTAINLHRKEQELKQQNPRKKIRGKIKDQMILGNRPFPN